MSRRALKTLNVALGAALVTVVLGSLLASGAAGTQYATFSAAAFTPVQYSDHNKTGSSVCPDFVPHSTGADQFQGGAENQGDLDAGHVGSYVENVRLPDGADVQSFSGYIQDQSGDDAFMFLTRKLIQRGLSPRFQGLKVMGKIKSSGAVADTMRQFTDSSIKGARIDNQRYEYFIELVVCENIEPFAAQVAYN